jgi:peptidase M23-like protein
MPDPVDCQLITPPPVDASETITATVQTKRSEAPTSCGNLVVIDIGAGRYVMTAHLQPGSIRVRVGDTTRVGQRIGSVGNSGNTSEPHPQNQVQNLPIVDRTELTDSSPDGFGFGVAVSGECNAQSVDAGLIITGLRLTLKRNWDVLQSSSSNWLLPRSSRDIPPG